MNKPDMCFFFDDVIREYKIKYNEEYEKIMIRDLRKYLADFAKRYEITILTLQDISHITEWFSENNLLKFVDNITDLT